MTANSQQGQLFLRVLLWIAIVLVALVVMPFIGPLFAAAVFATVLFPLQVRLARRFGDRPQLAATTITVVVSMLVILPLAGMTFVVGKRVASIVDDVVEIVDRDGMDGLVERVPEGLRPLAARIAAALSIEDDPFERGFGRDRRTEGRANGAERAPDDVGEHVDGAREPERAAERADGPAAKEKLRPVDSKAVVSTSAKLAQDVVTWLTTFAIDVGILILALFFLLAQGGALVRWVLETVPLPESRTQQFVDEFRAVTIAVFRSTVVSAFVQTILATVGYLIAGTPMLLTVVMLTLLGSFVPVVGGGTIVVVVGLVTLIADSTGWGIFLIAWGCLPVAISDNLLRPMLARGRLHLPGSVLFFAMLGGLALMGPMGLIGGPLVVTFLLVVLRALRAGQQSGAVVATDPA